MAQNGLHWFFAKNLFERAIIYIFLAELLVKIFFELLGGQWYFALSHQKQFIFFGLIGLDYLLSMHKIVHIRLKANYTLVFLGIFSLMIIQGVVMGLLNHNKPMELINDTIPLIIFVLNALRMQSLAENRHPIDFKFLLYAISIMASIACLAGFIALQLGLPSRASAGGLTSGLYFPLFFAGLLTLKRMPIPLLAMAVLIFGFSVTDINRTTMIFIALCIAVVVLAKLRDNIVVGLASIAAIMTIGSIGWMSLPEDSMTYRRIVGLANLDTSARTGSVGERQAEYDAINVKLTSMGNTVKWLGVGHGGTYEVQYSHQYIKDYGHAHYAWAMFALRYGNMGYFYLMIFAVTIILNIYRNWTFTDPVRMGIALMSLQAALYLMTYVNFVLLCSGVQFLYIFSQQERQKYLQSVRFINGRKPHAVL